MQDDLAKQARELVKQAVKQAQQEDILASLQKELQDKQNQEEQE